MLLDGPINGDWFEACAAQNRRGRAAMNRNEWKPI
jgi:hypothetical protein